MSENSETRRSSISKADSYEAIGEFWDTHSSAEYWEQGHDVEFEIHVPRRHRINIEADLFERIASEARRRGISTETLVNLWMAERLRAVKIVHASTGSAVATVDQQVAEEGEVYVSE